MAQQGSGYQARYKRILLKLSGEALMGSEEFGIDPKVLDRMALEVGQLVGIGVQVGLVIGGGNPARGEVPGKLTLDLGGVQVQVWHPGPGHTRGDTIAWVEDEKVLFETEKHWAAPLWDSW